MNVFISYHFWASRRDCFSFGSSSFPPTGEVPPRVVHLEPPKEPKEEILVESVEEEPDDEARPLYNFESALGLTSIVTSCSRIAFGEVSFSSIKSQKVKTLEIECPGLSFIRVSD